MDKKPSEYIGEFLRFVREATEKYHTAQAQEKNADMETQDVLHWLEFCGRKPENKKYAEKVQEVLGDVRERRREAKNTVEILDPVIEWGLSHTETVRSLEQLLGTVRKVEKAIESRFYTDRTMVMAEILGTNTEGGKVDGQ